MSIIATQSCSNVATKASSCMSQGRDYGNQVWLFVLSLLHVAQFRQTSHLMHEASAKCIDEGGLFHDDF